MAANPYTPPKADVKDVGPERALGERPRQVVYAVVLLWISFALGVPAAYWEHQRTPADVAPVYWVLAALIIGLFILVIVFLGRGRNWARIVLLVLVVISFLSFLGTMGEMLSHPAIEIVLNVVTLAIDAVAVYLVFTKPGALWFRRAD
jgi:hypothetical protein